MDFVIEEYNEYNEKEILKLYESVGWKNYTNNPDMLKKAYENSLKIFGAYKNGELLGIIRVVGDGYSIIFIQNIVVFPKYHRHGIGTQLLKYILETYQHVYQKILLTDNLEKTIKFYSSVGFEPASNIGCIAFIKM